MKQLMLFVFLTACGKETVVYTNNGSGEVLPVETAEVESTQQLIDEVVADKNEYRDSLGQSLLTEGLNCTVHNAASPDLDVSFGSAAYSYTMKADFNQPAIAGNQPTSILPAELAALYVNKNFSVRCQGYIVVTESDLFSFELESDDGSRLYVNGALIIDNEGAHAMVKKAGVVALERGVHSLRIDYSQSAGGQHGLVFTSEGEVVEHAFFYR
jgi:hypothetical protein